MDIKDRYAGYTHIALNVDSVNQTASVFKQLNYAITEEMQFANMKAIFIRDPDRNVIEFNEYAEK